jgi:hypothetical protein
MAVCRACGADEVRTFHSQPNIPTNSCLLLEDEGEALAYPKGDLELGHCTACGFVQNERFDARLAEYSSRYEETQAYSPTFQAFCSDLARRWVEKYDLAGRRVVEIGCGKGEFLVAMAEHGIGEGIGIDPGTNPSRIGESHGAQLTWITDFYSERYRDLVGDAIVCRHTLEHIADVESFMRTIRRSLGDRHETAVLFELPDVLRVLEEGAFWDVYYEHCSYFSPGSLVRLFQRTGFDVVDVSLDYDEQYILIEAFPSTAAVGTSPDSDLEHDLGRTALGVSTFQEQYAKQVTHWRDELRAVAERGGRSVIWGAGSKGVAFLNVEHMGAHVSQAVDVNPFKHGKFIAGTGHPIVAPEALVSDPPELVIVMNPAYVGEISSAVAEMGIDARVAAV